ncbi:aromatic ring-hydroxylating dioxygenase subunit alpha [Cobetia sp. UIB-001]|uniref:aromatic ring-hydroxylating oxygenase subunit alpha n=1 Tax=Cobetia sp. UIB-001 TaxID=2717697 RepID=UPI00384F390C
MSSQPIRALDPKYYTDSAFFEKERQTLLASTWQYASHVSQIPNSGDYFRLEIAGESLFCVRGKKGEIRTFYNVCQHRGHEIVTHESGNTRMLVCPYHSWSYDLGGRLRNGPNLDAVEGLDKGSICLPQVRTDEFCGFIFVNLDPDAKSMDEVFPGVREELREFVPHIDELAPLEYVAIEEDCNWKVSVENYSECYHCSANHHTFVDGIIKPETYRISHVGYTLQHTTECQNLDRMSYPVDPESNPRATQYKSWFLWPGFSFQVYPGNVLNTYHWRPMAVDKVMVYRGWYTIGGEESDVIRGLAEQDRDTTVAEDVRLVESVQRGLKSRGYQGGPLVVDPTGGVMSEHSIVALNNWVREAIDA